jgi:hypothetical protein
MSLLLNPEGAKWSLSDGASNDRSTPSSQNTTRSSHSPRSGGIFAHPRGCCFVAGFSRHTGRARIGIEKHQIMKSRITFALAAGIIGTLGLTGLAGTAKAAISTVSGQSLVAGDYVQINFDSSTGRIANHSWNLGSDAYNPGELMFNGDFENPDYYYMGGHPARLRFEAGWYTNVWTVNPLSAGALIDSSSSFNGGTWLESSLTEVYYGIRTNTETSYGANDGGIHYGWVKLSYNSSTGDAQLLGGAINTIAGQGITAGQTTVATSPVPETSTSFGLLALGAGGLLTRRRLKRAAWAV